MSVTNGYNGLEIAIIGMSAHFAICKDYREYWKSLKEGKDLLKTFTTEELREKKIPENIIQNRRYIRTTGVMNDKGYFDSSFFEYTPD